MNARPKSLLKSKTVWSMLLFLAAYYTVKITMSPAPGDEDPNALIALRDELLQHITVIGVALTAVFLRSGLISLLDSPAIIHTPSPSGEPAAPRVKNKSLWSSKTFLTAILLVVAHFGAKYKQLPPDAIQGVFMCGTAALVIFIRHGMLSAQAGSE
jgi:hypothetical protein